MKGKKNKDKKLPIPLVVIVWSVAVLVLMYFGIIIAQHIEFNKLDQSLVGETISIDKDVSE